jgi:hypothetical protein
VCGNFVVFWLTLVSALFLVCAVPAAGLHALNRAPQSQAEAASPGYPLRIKVLSEKFHLLYGKSRAPKDCDPEIFSAACSESRDRSIQNIMLVQDGDGKTFSITCTVRSQWSKCAPLPVGKTLEARMEKHGITVLYRDSTGKKSKQFYKLVTAVSAPPSSASADSKPSAPSASATGSAQEVPPDKAR